MEEHNDQNDQLKDLSNRITRSTVAVIDTVAARGGFRGEELATIGQLRDQCIACIQTLEAMDGVPKETTEE